MSKVYLIEAGFTTELNQRVKVDDNPLWGSQCLAKNENANIDTHREFIRRGVDIMVTNTYQASVEGFRKYLGLNDREAFDLIKKSVSLCRKAIEIEKSLKMISENKEVLIAGSVGPYGAFLCDGSEYTGAYISTCDLNHIKQWHRSRIQALIDGGADLLAFETIPAVQEAEVLIELLEEFPSMKAWLSFSCKDENHLSYGQSFIEAAERCWSLNSTQIIAIGVNCLAVHTATKLVAQLIDKNIPAIIYPNCGAIWDACKKVWVSHGVEESNDIDVEKWCNMGVKYVGGCCGTSMETYRNMRTVIDEYNEKLSENK